MTIEVIERPGGQPWLWFDEYGVDPAGRLWGKRGDCWRLIAPDRLAETNARFWRLRWIPAAEIS